MFTLSGKLQTLAGPFVLEADGSQSGLIIPLGQIVPVTTPGITPASTIDKTHGFNIVWPPGLATGKPIYPAP